MKSRMAIVIVGLLLVASSALAADVDGKWSGSVDTPNGALTIVFTFKAEGSTLTGTQSGPNGGGIAIKNGKIDGDRISFDVDVNYEGMPFTLSYKGVVAKDQIKLGSDFGGGPFEYVVKRTQ